MKPTLINRTLQPPEPSDNNTDGQIQELLDYVKRNYKPTDLFDMHDHDKAVSMPFAEYVSYHYVTVRTEEEYRHKKGGEWFSTNQVWDEYNQPKNNKL